MTIAEICCCTTAGDGVFLRLNISTMSNSIWELPIATNEKALAIRKEIEALQESINSILGGATTGQTITATKVDGRKGKRSAATLARMAASAKARWAKRKGSSPGSAVKAP